MLILLAVPLMADEKKVVVLGVDALDQRLMDQYIEEGHLPNFKKLAEDGHYSGLETSYPPMSPAAWSTMTTGMNPGKTGIFGFLKRNEGSYEPELSLVRANEQPVAGGNLGNRLLLTLAFSFGLFGLAYLMALLWKWGKGQLTPSHPLVAGCITLGMILASMFTVLGPLSTLLGAAAVLGVGTLAFGYVAVSNRLKPYTWTFPILALATGVFGFLNTLPETLPEPVTARGGTTFWKVADDHGVRSRVIGAPVAWPADEGLAGSKMTTGLATPDAMGTFHTYTLFTEPHHELAGGITEMSGRVESLEFEDGVAHAVLLGPPAKFDRERWKLWEAGELPRMPREQIPFTVKRKDDGGVTLTFGEQAVEENTIELAEGEWCRHFRVKYQLGVIGELHGDVSFKLLAGGNRVRLYATPVQFDPFEPDKRFAISDPLDFAPWLANEYGVFQTIGWAEATSALNDGVIDHETFLETCEFSFDEKREQILGLLERDAEWDMLVAFTYEVDRVCHMMWRHMDPTHPNHDPTAPTAWRNAIRDFYVKYDTLVGEVLERLPDDTVLIVCSDHGFAPFYRAVNLNRWLRDEGYLVLKEDTGAPTMEHLFDNASGYYDPYDWSRTKAYALGLSKIYINREGREPQGIVGEKEADALMDEIIAKLKSLRDDEAHGHAKVISGVWKATDIWEGDRVHEAGDLPRKGLTCPGGGYLSVRYISVVP